MWLLGVAASLAVAACGGGPSLPRLGPRPGDRRQLRRRPHADGGEVRIEAGMLRDLRLTTAQVESRQGGEQVTLLGELAVDERAYAEVGAPVAARVVRLLAGVGDRVARRPAAARAAVAGSRTRAFRLPARGRPADAGGEQPEAQA